MGSGEEHARRVEALEQATAADLALLLEVVDEPKECWHTRTAAVRSLVRLDARDAAPAILKLLARDRDPDTREACIDALAHFRFPQARRVFERLSQGDDPLAARARLALQKLEIYHGDTEDKEGHGDF